MRNFRKNNGITLIALLVTIIVLLILATVSITAVFGDNGLLKLAKEAKSKTMISQKEEEVSRAIASLITEHLGNTGEITVEEVVEKVKKNYSKQEEKDAIIGTSENEDGKFPGTIEYDRPASGLDEKIVVTVDENLSVTSDTTKSDSNESSSTYSKVGNVYCNSPDLSGFNKEATYYITYDASGEETIYGRLDKVEPPTEWYDYEAKKWANIVTVTDDEVAYWVWIPRYKYKINGKEDLDAKFVTVGDKCIQVNEDGSEQELDLTDYLLPESFRFGEEGKEVELAGFWMSKYEVQDSANNTEFARIINVDGKDVLTVTDVNGKQLSNITGTYTIYVNGDVKNAKTGVTLPVEVSTLNLGAKKDIMVAKEEGAGKKIIGAIKDKTDEAVIKVDTSGFNPKATYYITYDDVTGEEKIAGRMDKVSAPTNWYNYKEKKWANIVTVTENDITYWTYIPRYEYKTFSELEYVDVKFISQGQTTPDKNYQIPESFRFGEEGKKVELAGFWISKYEVQDSTSNAEKLSLSEDGTLTTTASNVAENTYTIYVNGVAKTGQKLPAKLSDLGVDTNNKDICVVNETSKMIVGAIRDSEK